MTLASTYTLACGSWGPPQVNLMSLDAKSLLEQKRMSYRYSSGRKTHTGRAHLLSEGSLSWKQGTRSWHTSKCLSWSRLHRACCGPRCCVKSLFFLEFSPFRENTCFPLSVSRGLPWSQTWFSRSWGGNNQAEFLAVRATLLSSWNDWALETDADLEVPRRSERPNHDGVVERESHKLFPWDFHWPLQGASWNSRTWQDLRKDKELWGWKELDHPHFTIYWSS